MCGAPVFSISSRDACMIIGACVIFSPLIAVGAIGYGVCKGTAMGVKKVKKSADHRAYVSSVKSAKTKAKYALKKQRNRALKALGEEEYQRQLQASYDATQTNPCFQTYFQFAMAVFLNEDYHTANDAMESAIALGRAAGTMSALDMGEAHYLRGIMLEHLNLYTEAVQSFDTAAEFYLQAGEDAFIDVRTAHDGVTQVPAITLPDVYNAQGFIRYLLGVEEMRDETASQQYLKESIVYFTRAIESTRSPRPSFHHNRGMAYHALGCLVAENDKEVFFVSALPDLDAAVNDENHDAPGLSMALKAFCLHNLKQADEAATLLVKAHELDESLPQELRFSDIANTPWRLPRSYQNLGDCYAPHDWHEVVFKRPSWCDNCMKFITLSQAMAKCYECAKCKMRIHKECKDNLVNTVCWEDVHEPIEVGDTVRVLQPVTFRAVRSAGKDIGTVVAVDPVTKVLRVHLTRQGYDRNVMPSLVALEKKGEKGLNSSSALNHTHQLKKRSLHRPHWCDLCKKWIPQFWGYMCRECGILIHKDCVPSNAVVLDK
eukprot:PhF_6_TR1051/c1_g1_i1/m.2170